MISLGSGNLKRREVMKKNIGLLVIIICIGVFSSENGYAFFGKKKEAEKTKVEAPVVESVKNSEVKVEEKKVEKKKVEKKTDKRKNKEKELRKKKKSQMNDTMWDVSIIHMSGKGKKKSDVLMFNEEKYASKEYKNKGFGFSNYTVNVKEDGAVVWETMQTADSGEVIFWRGEVDAKLKNMRGVLSVQLPAGASDDYSFISKEKKPYKE